MLRKVGPVDVTKADELEGFWDVGQESEVGINVKPLQVECLKLSTPPTNTGDEGLEEKSVFVLRQLIRRHCYVPIDR